MKSIKISALIPLLFVLMLMRFASAQSVPQAFNYSGVARSPSGQPISNSIVGIQISIAKSNPTGAVVFSENHVVFTDTFGVFNLIVGGGAIQSGSFSSIAWNTDEFHLVVGMDLNGGTNFTVMGSSKLISRPYAAHSKTANHLVVSGTSGNSQRYVGEAFGGGVIFHLWKDLSGIEHGLIVDVVDLSTSQIWSNITSGLIGAAAQSSWDGLGNSNAIATQPGHANSAADLCLNSTNGGQSDWYLPSVAELSLLWHNRFNVNKALSSIPGATPIPMNFSYWSSTEQSSGQAKIVFNTNGTAATVLKSSLTYVRAIRAF